MRGRLLALVAVTLAAVAVALALLRDVPPAGTLLDRLVPGGGPGAGERVPQAEVVPEARVVEDVLAWDEDRREELERRAAAGLSHVLFARSPGGAVPTAARVERWRPLVEAEARRSDLDPDDLEALVFLESAGFEDAMAGGTRDAVGLTQILAETGQNLLGMRIDVRRSARYTRGIRRGRAVARRVRLRRSVDERYDGRKALAATGRYLRFAREQLGRDDLALVSYHMGVGNLQRALAAYGDDDVPYAQLFFDSSPTRHARAWSILASLGDDSSTYLWRLRAAREIMRLHRDDPRRLGRLAALHARKNSAEEVLHPPGKTKPFADPAALDRAIRRGTLVQIDGEALRRGFGVQLSATMGELVAPAQRARYRTLRPAALAVLTVIGRGVREISGAGPLVLTSTARDRRYQQRILASGNPEATRSYSLHTTGWAFDIRRRYRSRAQAQAFQFWLDRLQALDLIAWVREPGAIHVTVGPRAKELLDG